MCDKSTFRCIVTCSAESPRRLTISIIHTPTRTPRKPISLCTPTRLRAPPQRLKPDPIPLPQHAHGILPLHGAHLAPVRDARHRPVGVDHGRAELLRQAHAGAVHLDRRGGLLGRWEGRQGLLPGADTSDLVSGGTGGGGRSVWAGSCGCCGREGCGARLCVMALRWRDCGGGWIGHRVVRGGHGGGCCYVRIRRWDWARVRVRGGVRREGGGCGREGFLVWERGEGEDATGGLSDERELVHWDLMECW